jgi:phosphoribosylanthranilate isomerase
MGGAQSLFSRPEMIRLPINTKICGVTNPEALDAAIAGGANHVGFVFFPKSPRNIDPEAAGALAERAGGRVKCVGLFVDPEPGLIDEVRKRVRLDVIQLHGDEHPALVSRIRQAHGLEVWKAIPVKTSADLAEASKYAGSASHVLYDAKPPKGADLPGGTGMRFDWKLLEGVDHRLPWILAGGLDPRNVREAIGITGARFVDVSSGVEDAPGLKSVDKIAAFLKAASL